MYVQIDSSVKIYVVAMSQPNYPLIIRRKGTQKNDIRKKKMQIAEKWGATPQYKPKKRQREEGGENEYNWPKLSKEHCENAFF